MAASWKKALGLVKDRTSIGLAKFASARVPELDVAIVKATSHDDAAVDEKYVQEIFHLTAISLGYANACLQALTKRIGKTRDWIVAIKVLVLTHRLLREGNPAFEDDLKSVSRRSLNVINFRDESHSNAWDFSAFVRNYASYLDARLDCSVFSSAPRGAVRSGQDDHNSAYRETRHSVNNNRSSFSANSYNNGQFLEAVSRRQKIPVKEMEPDMLIEVLPPLQLMIERVLACRPTGVAKNHRLVQVSLYMIAKESFQIYSDICEGIGSLLNVYYDMRLEDCSRTFDIYARFARQSDSLASFYNSCKSIGICRPTEYPPVEKVSQDYLDSLEDFLRNRARSARFQQPTGSNTKGPLSPHSDKEIDPASFERMYGVRALPAPPTETPQKITKVEKQPDLIDLGDDEPSTGTVDDKMALVLFSNSSGATISNNWATFDTPSVQEPSQKSAITNTQSQPSLDATNKSGLTGWELALVSEASSLANVKAAPTIGNFDRFQFESMYNEAAFKPNTALALPGSASSVAVFARPTAPFLALPAPGSLAGQDPFTASATVAPPRYVQMADLNEKQRYLLQEQQHWQQAQISGAYGHYGLVQFYSAPYAGAAAMAPQTSFGVPYYGMAGYAQSR